MSERSVPRRDFSRHWALTPRARRAAHALKHAAESLDALPAPLFALLLGALAGLAARGSWPWTVGLWLFMAGDWVMLGLLPRFGRSYGPAQSAAFLLAVLRAACALLPFPAALAAQSTGSVLAWYALWIEPHRIATSRQILRTPKLRPGIPLRVLHVGDLHVERVTGRERQLVRITADLTPDLVLYSGDLLNTSYVRDREAWDACRGVLERMSAPLGVFVVSGSRAADPDDVMVELLAGLPVRWLRDERVRLECRGQSLDLIGVGCTPRPAEDRPRLERLLRPTASACSSTTRPTWRPTRPSWAST